MYEADVDAAPYQHLLLDTGGIEVQHLQATVLQRVLMQVALHCNTSCRPMACNCVHVHKVHCCLRPESVVHVGLGTLTADLVHRVWVFLQGQAGPASY